MEPGSDIPYLDKFAVSLAKQVRSYPGHIYGW